LLILYRKDAVKPLPNLGGELTTEVPRRPLDTTFEKRCTNCAETGNRLFWTCKAEL
jgi:hypothetical protein